MKTFSFLTSVGLAVILTSILALSAHAIIIQNFTAPPINMDPKLNQIIGFVIQFATVMGTVLIYFLSKPFWNKIKPSYRVILFALLIMALAGSLFRSVVMNIVVGAPWGYQVLSTIPSYAGWLTLSILVCFYVSIIQKNNKFVVLQFMVFSFLTVVIMSFIKKLTNDLVEPLLSLVPQIDIANFIHIPYGMKVLVPAYITFLEPTIASFVLFYLIKNNLSAFNTLMKGLIMGGILIIIHARIYSMIQILFSEGNILYRVFYYGQFLWECLTLGILTAYSVTIIEKSTEAPLNATIPETCSRNTHSTSQQNQG